MKQYNFKLIYKKYNKQASIIKNIVILFFLLLFATLTTFYALGKFRIFHVVSNSAYPYHPQDCLVFDFKISFDNLKVGDFITWSGNGGKTFVTHQIVDVNKENKTVTTSQQKFNDDGTPKTPQEILDMNTEGSTVTDNPITEDKYYGKVLFSIPKLGLYLTGIKNLVLSGNSINILGIVTLILAYLTYYSFGKLIYTPTYVLREKKIDKS